MENGSAHPPPLQARLRADPASFDYEERKRKRIAREGHKQSQDAQKLTGLRAKLYQKKRHAEKIQMKKAIKAHEERNVKSSGPNEPSSTPLPQYLLDRSNQTNAKALSSAIKVRSLHLLISICLQADAGSLLPIEQTERESRKVCCSVTQSERNFRGGDVQGGQDRKEDGEEGLETSHHEAYFRRP